jgi:hypothetical protein
VTTSPLCSTTASRTGRSVREDAYEKYMHLSTPSPGRTPVKFSAMDRFDATSLKSKKNRRGVQESFFSCRVSDTYLRGKTEVVGTTEGFYPTNDA